MLIRTMVGPVESTPQQDRRRGGDRRTSEGRRAEDQSARFRDAAATLIAFCGALALLFLFFGLLGAVDFGDAVVFTIVIVVLALIWVFGVW